MMANLKRYKVVLDVWVDDTAWGTPDDWDWDTLASVGPGESVDVVESIPITARYKFPELDQDS